MTHIRRIYRSFARNHGPHGTAEPRASRPEGRHAGLADQPGRFTRRMTAAATVAAGQHGARQRHQRRPGGGARRFTMITPGLLPYTLQLCIHCRQNPAGFWVSAKYCTTVHRPLVPILQPKAGPGPLRRDPFQRLNDAKRTQPPMPSRLSASPAGAGSRA